MNDNNGSKNPSADHPVISPKERLIEKGLRGKVHASYRDMPWWKHPEVAPINAPSAPSGSTGEVNGDPNPRKESQMKWNTSTQNTV